MKIVDAKEVTAYRESRPRKSPATRMIEELPPDMMIARQVAELFGVNIETIRRLARAKNEDGKPRFTAPSKAAKSGDLVIWVYTPEDVDELAEYFGERVPKKRGKKK
jgi:Trk K+ transport system NAD-binding subunit